MKLHRARPGHLPLQRWARRGRVPTRRDASPTRPRPSGLSDARTLREGPEPLAASGAERAARGAIGRPPRVPARRPEPPGACPVGSEASAVGGDARPPSATSRTSARTGGGPPPGSRPAGCGRPRPRGGIPAVPGRAAGRARSPPREQKPEPGGGRPSGRSQAVGGRPRERVALTLPPARARPSRVRSSVRSRGAGRCPGSEVAHGAVPGAQA